MPKEYIFRYTGSKESFLAALDPFHTNNSGYYYLDDYIIEVLDDEIRFGIERTAHSAGKWFISKFTEENGQIEFRGTVRNIRSDNTDSEDGLRGTPKVFEKIKEVLWFIFLFILAFPFLVIIFAVSKIQWLIRKIRKQPSLETTEDRLFYLMERRLNCQRVADENDS